MSYNAPDETMAGQPSARPVWPDRTTQDDWHSVREKVRMSGTAWSDDDNPASTALRQRYFEPAPAPQQPTSPIAAALARAERVLTAWEQLPDRLKTRIYVGVGVTSVLLFFILAAKI
jgi:hypothetical protein